MDAMQNIKLEILRPGPSHNQLLSPLTPYLAICHHDGPVTINLPFEHRQILTRLERLRYYSGQDRIADNQREAELREMGEALGQILGRIPGLIAELGRVRANPDTFIHLRLAFSAHELALVPFECAIAPDGFPGSGSPLFLQTNTPITLTREIRHGQDLKMDWDRKPRILFIYATPGQLQPVPFNHHLLALRQAIDPWVAKRDTKEEQVKEVAEILTLLPEATLTRIRQTCADKEFTHVHILGHGAPYESGGDRRYGLALCLESDPTGMDVVDGERLALALTTGRATSCSKRSRPTVVTLATCDSANVESVLTPGGSIAHELHAAGIPWVFASQFPLWMRSSTIFTAILYKRLLQGADPRCILHELRQRLRTTCPETHDWASIVAYATIPHNFEEQLGLFLDRQFRAQIDSMLARTDHLLKADEDGGHAHENCETEIIALSKDLRSALDAWRESCDGQESGRKLAERLGISGACEKRIGIVYTRLAERAEAEEKKQDKEKERRQAFEKARSYYRQAMEAAPGNHWHITQYLSMQAILDQAGDAAASLMTNYGHWWRVAKEISHRQLTSNDREEQSWALSSMAELELLGTVYGGLCDGADGQARTIEWMTEWCAKLLQAGGPDSFLVKSTIRQFRRYRHPTWNEGRKEWGTLAALALKALGD